MRGKIHSILILMAAALIAAAPAAFAADHGRDLEAEIIALVPESFQEWQKKAEAGDAFAQTVLGYAYEVGKAVPRNATETAKWYKKAAEQGFALAQSRLGLMYGMGLGVSQDYVEAQTCASWPPPRGMVPRKNGRRGCPRG